MNKFAISSAGIGEAMRRSASALAAAGNDINESIGLVTAMNTVVQDPDSVGTALKTISMYLRAAKTDAEEAGISTDGMAESVSALREELKMLTGVDIMINDSTFKSTYDIMKALSEVWDQLTDITQANVLELIGGKRNGNVITSLLTNFDEAVGAMEAARESAGSAAAENEKYLDSINGKLQIMQANFEALVNSVVDSDLVKAFLDLSNKLLSVVQYLQDINFLIPTVLAGISGMMAMKNRNAAGNVLGTIMGLGAGVVDKDVTDQSDIYKQTISNIALEVGKLNNVQRERLAVNLAAAASEGKLSKELSDNIFKLGILSDAYVGAGQSATGFKGKILGLVSSIPKAIGGLMTAVDVAAVGYTFYKSIKDGIEKRRQETIDEGQEVLSTFDEAKSAYDKNVQSLQALKEEYDELSKGVGDSGENIGLTASEYSRFLEILEEIETISPSVVSAYDAETDAVNRYKGAISGAIKEQEKLYESQMAARFGGTDEVVASAQEQYKNIQNEISGNGVAGFAEGIRAAAGKNLAQANKIIESVIGSYDNYFGDDFSMGVAIAEHGTEIVNALRAAVGEDGLPLFDPKGIDKTAQAIGAINAQLSQAEDLSRNVADQFMFGMDYEHGYQNFYGHGDATKQYDQIISAGLQDVFSEAMMQIVDLEAEDGGEDAALAFLESFTSAIASDGFQGMIGLIRQLKDGEISLQDFNAALNDMYLTGDAVIDQALFGYLNQQAEHAVRIADGVADYNIKVAEVANGPLKMFEAGQKGFELLGQAMEEMAADGEVSMDTLSKLQNILPDGIDIMEQFVDMSSGKRVLDENALRDFWRDYVYSEVDTLRQNAASLEKQSVYYDAMAQAVKGESDALVKLIREDMHRDDILGDLTERQRKTTKEALEKAGFDADGFNEDGLFLTTMSAGKTSGDNKYDFAYDANVVFSLTPVYHDAESGQDITMSADSVNEYIRGILDESGGDIDKAMELDASQKKLMISYELVEDGQSEQEIREMIKERNELFNEGYMVNFDLADGSQDFSYKEMEARAKATADAAKDTRQAAEDYNAAMRGVETSSDLLDLSSMWDTLEKQAQSSAVILDAQKQVTEGAMLSQAQLMELAKEHPEYDWFATSGDIDKQKSLLEEAARAEEAAFQRILETRRANLVQLKTQEGATQEQIAAADRLIAEIDAMIAAGSATGSSVMESLFPTEETNTWEQQQKKIEEIISTVQQYSETIQAVQDEIAAGGALTPETMLSMQSLFGANWKEFLTWDETSTKAIEVNMQKASDYVNGFIDKQLQGIDATGDFANALHVNFSADPGPLKAGERLQEYIDILSSASELISASDKEVAAGGSNSLSTLESLISLMGDDYAQAVSFADGKITILKDKVVEWQTSQLAALGSLGAAEKQAIEDAYEQAHALEELQGAISDVGDASSLIETIQQEIAESGYNSFDTLSSFIEMMGEDWEKHVSFSEQGLTLSTTAIYDQLARSIDNVSAASEPLKEQLKQQLRTSMEVEQATKSLSDAYSGLETAVSGYTNIGSSVELTHDMISQLIEVDARYAQAIEYQNGRLQLNKERYDEITESVKQNTAAQAEAAAQAILSGEEYQNLVRKMMNKSLTASEQNRLDSLNAQVMAFEVMASAVDSSTSALQRFLNATDQVNAVTYDGAKEAFQTIQDVLYNKDSDMYGMVGHEKFEEAMKLMISPDVEIDTKEFDRQYRILTRYFEESGKGMDNLYNDMLKTGIIDKATGQIETTVGEAAKLLGLTENAFRYAVDQYNQYQQDEHKIDIGGKTNEELQEQTGIGKLMEDTQTVQETVRELTEETELDIPVDPTLEGIAAVNLGLTDTKNKVSELNGTPIDVTPTVATEGTQAMDDYIAGLKEEAKIEVNTSGATRALNKVTDSASGTYSELDAVSSAAYSISAGLDSISSGELDVDTSSIFKDLIDVLSKLGDIAKKLNAIDGMDVDASVNVTQKTSSSGSGLFTSDQMDLVNKYIFGNASASGTRQAAGGKTLVGELGMETVVDPATNKWYTVGIGGPEFVNLPKNAIVLNAEQTQALFKSGRAHGRGQSMISGNTRRGRAMATGNFAVDDDVDLIFVDWRKEQKKAQEVVDTISSAAPTVSQVVAAAQKASGTSSEKVSGTTQKPKTSSSKKSSGSGGSSSSSSSKEEEQSVLEKLQEQYQKLIDQHEHLIEHQEFLFRNAERGMDFAGMETSLENQVKIYKDLMEDAQKGISEMVANGASDTDEELQALEQAYWNAHDSMYEALNELSTLYVDGLTEKIDGIQSAYGNLANAANELAESGSISVDTFQALINNGVEYMSLLEKVNGQYVINEEGINKLVAAEKKRLAVESALSYLSQVQQAVNDKDTHLLANLTDLSNRIGQSSWDAVYAQAELLKNLGLSDDQYAVVLENINALKSVSEAVSGDITSDAEEASNAITGGLKDQQSALDEILKLTQDLIEHETEERIEAIEDEIDQFKEIIKLKKESLDVTRDENDYMDSVAEKTAEIAKLQAKIDQLSLDDSRSALAERAALQEELAKLQKDLGELQGDHAYDAQIEALEKQEEAYEQDRQQEITSLEESVSSAEKLYQASIQRLNSGWSSLYDQLIAWNTEVGSSLNSEITSQWEQAAEAVKLYGSYSAAVKNVDAAINAGKDKNIAVSKSDLPVFHSGGVVGGGGLGDEIMAVVQKGEVIINEAGQEVLYRIIDFQRYLGEKLGSAFGNMDFSSSTMRNAVSAIPTTLGALSGAAAEASGAFVFSPTITVEISGGDMDTRNAKQFGEKIAATAIDQLREAFGRKGVSGSMSTRLRQS